MAARIAVVEDSVFAGTDRAPTASDEAGFDHEAEVVRDVGFVDLGVIAVTIRSVGIT